LVEGLNKVPIKKVGEAKEYLKFLLKKYTKDDSNPLPTFLWGGTDIEKSSIVKQVVKYLGMDLEECFQDQRLQQIDSVDCEPPFGRKVVIDAVV